ncbi:hypothetical protein DFAR_3370014 [Desulfarculales bacterium]
MRKGPRVMKSPRPRETGITPCHLVAIVLCFCCLDGRAVIRLRPRGYWSRFQALVETIRQSVSNKLFRGRWAPGSPRFRQRHWLKGLLRQMSLYPWSSWSGDLLGAFDWLSGRDLAAVSWSAQSESFFPP